MIRFLNSQMKKRFAVFLWLIICIVCCLAAGGCKSSLSASDIYSRCIANVVEVKAVSENVGESFGTAEILDRDGTLVTNAHVVTYTRLNAVHTFDKYYIRFSDEEEYREVTLEKYDTEMDIALLKLDSARELGVKPVVTGNSDSLKAGERVFAVGNASNYGVGCLLHTSPSQRD